MKMADFPAWDYWRWELNSCGSPVVIDTGIYSVNDDDFRCEDYDLDENNWCTRSNFYWTAQEAALISFGRDPDKIKESFKERIENFPFFDGVVGPEDHELRQNISAVYNAILHAQETGNLQRRILRERYIDWARGEGIDFPIFVSEAINAFEREREALHERLSQHVNGMIAEPDDELPDEEVNSHDKKFRNNVRKVIVALLIHTGLASRGTKKLAEDLQAILNDKADLQKDFALKLGWQTIQDRLDEAHELLK
jgi:hypothetical protein